MRGWEYVCCQHTIARTEDEMSKAAKGEERRGVVDLLLLRRSRVRSPQRPAIFIFSLLILCTSLKLLPS